MSIEAHPDNFRFVTGYRYTQPGETGVFTYASTEPTRAERNFLSDAERGRVVSPLERYMPESEMAKAIATERAALRKWLGQQAKEARRDLKRFGNFHALGRANAFKEAADHLKPTRKVTK